MATVIALLALAASLAALGRVYLGSKPAETRPAPAYDDSELRDATAEHAELLELIRADYVEWKAEINLAVAEGIKHVERAENRIRATVRRAREELEEGGVRSPGLEAEAHDLFGEHGVGSEGRPMHAVPNGVVDSQPGNRFAAFPGDWS